MESPFFSVVIPTYNCADLLNRALQSVRNQTFTDFEVLVVDNMSVDNTREVLESFKDLNIHRYEIQNNGVIAASRNLGIKMARGQWVAFLDADDLWYPKKLEKVKVAIQQYPPAILVCHDEITVNNGISGKVLNYGPEAVNMYEKLLFTGNALSTSAVSVRRDVLNESGGFSEEAEFVTAEDYEFWIRLSRLGQFCFLGEVLGEYHLHGKNESSRIDRHARAVIAVVNKHLESLNPCEYSVSRLKRRKADVWCLGGRLFLRNGLFKEAMQYCLKGISVSPFTWRGWMVLILSMMRIRA